MALKFSSPFPLFSPNVAPSRRPAFSTELRFARWHNANAERFERRGREQKEIEDDIRRHRRHQSALRIVEDATAEDADFKSPPPSPAEFRSRGTPSSPSAPSIPGKASKYSKPPLDHKTSPPSALHPAFRRFSRTRIPPESDEESGISVGDSGIAYRIKGAPFEFQYSYTETPKVKPLAIREPYLPFGPTTMPRPWLGRAPLPPSKKKLPEFDSFKLPPPGKKGIKSIQAPGPFLPGSGPKYHTASREQILGEPLTEEEIKDLVKGSMKTRRQLNMGRDGLTHNMLDNIHALWKRRRVCKIKCKGVCTVDMDNVRQQLEEKTGGKIIYYKGGVIFLFRGRNYNYRTRPKYPLMLWKPVAPVYPRLVQRVPKGSTLEEATVMRKRGRQLPPICKLGKNGVYYKLVNQVREAFEACELVRINCKDMNQSDCRKIGAKLKDLVPCELVSFEYEHILMWRGKDWKSSLPPLENDAIEGAELITTDPSASPFSTNSLLAADAHISDLDAGMTAKKETTISLSTKDEPLDEHSKLVETEYAMPRLEGANELPRGTLYIPDKTIAKVSGISNHDASTTMFGNIPNSGAACSTVLLQNENEQISYPGEAEHTLVLGGATWNDDSMSTKLDDSTGETVGIENEERGCLPEQNFVRSSGSCLEGVMLLLRQAVDSGAALILDDQLSDANTVFEMSVTLAKTAPPGPTFGQRNRKADVQATEQEKSDNFEQDVKVQVVADSSRKINGKKKPRSQRRDIFNKILPDLVPHGSLAVDELAKLLA